MRDRMLTSSYPSILSPGAANSDVARMDAEEIVNTRPKVFDFDPTYMNFEKKITDTNGFTPCRSNQRIPEIISSSGSAAVKRG